MPLETITNSLQMKAATNPKVISDDAVVVSETFIQSICEFLVDLQESLADFFLHRSVKKIDWDPKTSKQHKEVQKALDKTLSILGNLKKKVRNEQRKEMIAIHHKVLQKPISVLEKIKSFVTLPEDLVPYIDIFFAKGTKLNVKVGLEDNLTFSSDLKLPGKGIKGKVHLTLPTTAAAARPAMPVDLHPQLKALLGAKLSPALSKEFNLNQIVDLLLTIPAQTMSIACVGSEGTADITLNLPSGAILKLELAIPKPADAKSQGDSDIVRSFMKGLLGPHFEGIRPLLGETFTFIWDGENSQFKINFLQQQAVRIDTLKLRGEGPLQALVAKIGKNGMIVIPPTIAGTVDFKKGSMQFVPGTKLVLKDFLFFDKDIDLHQVSYDVEKNTVNLSISCFGDRTIPIKLDAPKVKSAQTEESPLEKLDFKVIPFTDPNARKPVEQKKQVDEKKEKIAQLIPVFSQIQSFIKIPEAFASLMNMLFAKGSKLNANIDIQDNIAFTTEVKIPGAGITGQALLTVPMTPSSEEATPAKINEGLLELLGEQLKSLGSDAEMDKLLALLTMLPAQNIYVRWIGSSNVAKIDLDLPGGAHLKLDLIIAKEGNDIVSGFLKKLLKDNYQGIAPLLLQDYALTWNGSSSRFKVEFVNQQIVRINTLKLKGEGFIQNLVAKLIKNSTIVLPQVMSGTVDLERASVTFDQGTEFVLKGLLPFDKKIGFEKVTFRPKDNAIDLQIQCFGSHTAAVDLNTSNVDSVDMDILPYTLFVP